LMPLKPSHNLLVRGSNPCGGTKLISDLLIADACGSHFVVIKKRFLQVRMEY